MPRVIAIMNQKGGVGKTTTTLNLGAALAQQGKRVLLIDLDPQANLTIGVGTRAGDLSESVYEMLTDPKVDPARLVCPTQWERLHLIRSHIDLSGAELEMVTMIGRETRLSKALDPLRDNYDYILIDCLPSLSLLTVNAMATAGEVFVPLQAHPFALEGLGKLFEVVGMVQQAMNPALRVSGVLVTMYDGRTNVSRETLEVLRNDQRLNEHIFATTIKQNIKVAESQKDGIPVIHFDPHCHASKAYHALCSEVLEMEQGCKAGEAAGRIIARANAAGQPHPFVAELLATTVRPRSAPEARRQNKAGESGERAATPAEAAAKEDAAPAEEPPPAPNTTPARALVTESAKTPAPVAASPVPPNAATEAVVAAEPEPSAPAAVTETPEPPVLVEPVEPKPEVIGTVVVTEPPVMVPSSTPTPTRNSADAETLHPSGGVTVPGTGDQVAAAQSALAGTPALRLVSSLVEDEDYRPRLGLKPGSCRIPLPDR